MIDFNKLRQSKSKPKSIDPIDIFRRLPKPSGINDLYTSQAEVLQAWFDKRQERDTVIKLHTGGGKTLVGLLIAQSSLNETGEPALYLVPTVQLVKQTLEKAEMHGIPAVAYRSRKPLHEDFTNSKAVMVATYKALFHGKSQFGIRGAGIPQAVSTIILDDAHSAFPIIRDSFTLEVSAKETRDRYEQLTGLFRKAFRDMDRLGTFDDVLSGVEQAVLEIPYWAWHQQLDAVREQLKSASEEYGLVWPLLRDNLNLCHALVSRSGFTITSVLPLVQAFPSFSEAPRRVYMSATIADDSEIIRTFDATLEAIKAPLKSRSLAGVSERMILIPAVMPFRIDVRESVGKLATKTARSQRGSVILTPSDRLAQEWADVGEVATGSEAVENAVTQLQRGKDYGPLVLANRYDGIDLPGDACRLLVMSGLPAGTSNYELFRGSALYGGSTINRMIAQRLEQGIGRGARGSGDHCVVMFVGPDLAAWVSKEANFQLLTSATRAQVEIGAEISKAVEDLNTLAGTVRRSYERDKAWTEYYAETLAELVTEDRLDESRVKLAATERKAFNLWADGFHDKSISKIEKSLAGSDMPDLQIRGWMEQLAARIADDWGHVDRAKDLQLQAFAHNRNLLRPKVLPPYRPVDLPGSQAKAIVRQIGSYRLRRGLLQSFEETVSNLHKEASANQFEQSLAQLAVFMGFASERHDENGEGPDVLWLLPTKVGLVIEAKSRKEEKNSLTKAEHGQLLVAAEWFANNYPAYTTVRVSVHAKNQASRAAEAGASHALTYQSLARVVSDLRVLLTSLTESQLPASALDAECARLLADSPLNSKRFISSYLVPFEQV